MAAQLTELGEAQEWRIESAGVGAIDGQLATPETVQVAAERGVDVRRHRSRVTTGELLENFSLVLVMEQRHKDYLQQEFPQIAERVRLLTEMVDGEGEVWDPVGTGIENYRTMAAQLADLIERGMGRIRELAGNDGTAQILGS